MKKRKIALIVTAIILVLLLAAVVYSALPAVRINRPLMV